MGSLDPEVAERRRILFVDAFDSFANNIVGLLEQCLEAEVVLVRINDEIVRENLNSVVDGFDAVVVGPGPGHPANPEDVGFIGEIWKLDDAHILPVLGICLGFQSLCVAHGADVKRLGRARHGVVSRVTHSSTDMFANLGHLDATQYHSLRVDMAGPRRGSLANPNLMWDGSHAAPSLRPLAWDLGDETNGPILMAVRHSTKPFWGVQFHPESICTSAGGEELLKNWWAQAQEWLHRYRRKASVGRSLEICAGIARAESSAGNRTKGHAGLSLVQELRSIAGDEDVSLRWEVHSATEVNPALILEALGRNDDEVMMLDSQGHASGRFSILGLVVPGKTMNITYRVADRTLRYGVGASKMSATRLDSIDDAWPILQEALDLYDPRRRSSWSRAATPGDGPVRTGVGPHISGHLPQDSPFWGGFMGYISYEAGLETINVDIHPSCAGGGVPDINFAFIHRSIVVDHESSHVYIQSLLPGDREWILNTGRIIDELARKEEMGGRSRTRPAERRWSTETPPTDPTARELEEQLAFNRSLRNAQIRRPSESSYKAKVRQCQDFLASGDSYELCLTDETEITVDSTNGRKRLDEWKLYKRLRQKNPAPFGAFVRLSDVVVVGSSPERFLRWTRDGRCQFRPIKGTVRKGPGMSREQAYAILESSKERAENLMIVDLIRHDLSGVIGAESTCVPKLMVVEEYETVYQLVSVIEGQLPKPGLETGGATGLDVLKASLPPGSMTGAPKKRSCEILRDMEKRPRGLYSGVLGYMDVGGAGDFSVVIRTAVRGGKTPCKAPNGDNQSNRVGGSDNDYGDTNGHFDGKDIWRVGAGGAVTVQSTDQGEFQEMETKASSVLGSLFQ